jgi:hypothetical protein
MISKIQFGVWTINTHPHRILGYPVSLKQNCALVENVFKPVLNCRAHPSFQCYPQGGAAVENTSCKDDRIKKKLLDASIDNSVKSSLIDSPLIFRAIPINLVSYFFIWINPYRHSGQNCIIYFNYHQITRKVCTYSVPSTIVDLNCCFLLSFSLYLARDCFLLAHKRIFVAQTLTWVLFRRFVFWIAF